MGSLPARRATFWLPPAMPTAGRLPGVKARENVDDAAVEAVVEGVGEAREEGPPQAHRDLWKRLGQLRDEINDLLEGADEGVTKARALSVVRVTGQRNVGGRLRAEADFHS